MLKKTMKQIFTKKVNDWLSSITDDKVKTAIRKDLIITGGAFTSMIDNEVPNDYDCYFKTKETVVLVAEYYAKIWNESHKGQKNKLGKSTEIMILDGGNPSSDILNYYNISNISDSQSRMISNCPEDRVKIIFPSDGIVDDKEGTDAINASDNIGVDVTSMITELDETKADEIIKKEKKPYHPVFMSTNAITLSDDIQIVVRFYGEPAEVHSTYDFVHTKAYWTFSDNKVVIPEEVWEATVNKTLKYTGSKYPVASLFRLRKFINRGWTINAGQILKIAMQVSELNLKDVDVLEDQLVGVDSVYFLQLIESFRQRQQKNEDFVLDADYIMSVVDKIF